MDRLTSILTHSLDAAATIHDNHADRTEFMTPFQSVRKYREKSLVLNTHVHEVRTDDDRRFEFE